MDDLYQIDAFRNETGSVEALITINAGHKIFEGHFPGQPVLPGVCQVQIIKELLEKATNTRLLLKMTDQCKFLQMVDPTQTNRLTTTISYTKDEAVIHFNAVLKSKETVFLKMKGSFFIA